MRDHAPALRLCRRGNGYVRNVRGEPFWLRQRPRPSASAKALQEYQDAETPRTSQAVALQRLVANSSAQDRSRPLPWQLGARKRTSSDTPIRTARVADPAREGLCTSVRSPALGRACRTAPDAH